MTDDDELSDERTSPRKVARSPEELAKQLGRHITEWSMDVPALQLYRESSGITTESPEPWSNMWYVMYLESQFGNKDLGLNICSVHSWRKALKKKVELRQPRSKQNLAHLNMMAEQSILQSCSQIWWGSIHLRSILHYTPPPHKRGTHRLAYM